VASSRGTNDMLLFKLLFSSTFIMDTPYHHKPLSFFP
jgi:hypothetical protein